MLGKSRQAGNQINPLLTEASCQDVARGCFGDSDESRKKFDNFADSLRNLNQRWNDRF